jgi:ribosomal-protein-alanine N-acetyltransferase
MQRQREETNGPESECRAVIRVERMKVWDVEEILLVENTSFPTPWPAWAFVQDLRRSRSVCLVARIAESLAGYAVAWLMRREMHIGNLAVAQSFRRKGVGSKLLDELLRLAKQKSIKLVTLEVRASNRPAIHLYEKFGFAAIAIKPDYYRSEGEDAVVMAFSTD